MIGYCDQAQGSNRSFYAAYRSNGGGNAHFDFPTGGQHDWGNWAAQLGAMSGDLAARSPEHAGGLPANARYRGGVQQPVWFPPLVLAATLPAVALLVGGCTDAPDMTAGRRGPAHPSGPPDQNSGHGPWRPRTAADHAAPAAYLDGLAAAGVRRSTDLVALSIGSYICQGRAAGQPDQAVWDFVFPMVHGDLDDVDDHGATTGDSAPRCSTGCRPGTPRRPTSASPPNDSASRERWLVLLVIRHGPSKRTPTTGGGAIASSP
jgi:hypothetical protein